MSQLLHFVSGLQCGWVSFGNAVVKISASKVELKNKRVLVVGLGKSGLAAARFLKSLGARVTVSDARPAMLIAELSELLDQGFMVEAGSHGLLTFRRQDLIVVSPGVPMSTPVLSQVRAMGATYYWRAGVGCWSFCRAR